MKQLIILSIALLALGTGCGKKKAAREAEALRKEQLRQQSIHEDNQASLSTSHDAWVGYYLGRKGLVEGEMQVYVYAKGQELDYWYQDTLREGKVALDRLVAPKFPPNNATMINGNRIERSDAPKEKYSLEARAFPNPSPIDVVLDLDDESNLLDGSIISQELGYAWFTFDYLGPIQGFGPMEDLRAFSEPGDSFLFAKGRAPGALIIEINDEYREEKPSEQYLAGQDKSFRKF